MFGVVFLISLFIPVCSLLPPTTSPGARLPSSPTPGPAYCNGPSLLAAPSGTLNYTVGDYASRNCSWSFSARPGEVLSLSFSRFAISIDPSHCANCVGGCLKNAQGQSYTCAEVSSYCSNTVIRLVCPQTCFMCQPCEYNYARGVSSTGVEIFRACGVNNTLPMVITSTVQNLTLDVVWGYLPASNYTPIAATDGFTVSWRSVLPAPNRTNASLPCSGVTNILATSGSTGGTFRDGSGGAFIPNSNCLWVIRAPLGKFVGLEFTGFTLRSGISMGANGFTSCLTDYVRVYDGNLTDGPSPILGTFCGTRLPRQITSSQRYLSVQYITSDNAERTAVGFHASYNFTSTPGPRPRFCRGQVNVTSPGTIVQSGDYGPSSCRWTVTAPVGKYVLVEFVELSIEPSFPSCESDFIEVLDSSLLLMRLCDTVYPPVIISFSNSVDIMFYADEYIAGNGFTIFVNFVDTPGVRPFMCQPQGVVINASTNETGIIENGPVYGRFDVVNTNCTFLIQSPPSTTIKLIYRKLELDQGGCESDSVNVYDGSSPSSPLLQQACGTHPPDAVISSRNTLLIQYGANGQVTGSGFTIRYTIESAPDLHTASECAGLQELNASSPRTFSDNSDGSTPRMLCNWRITVPPGKYISLNVTKLDLGSGDDGCVYEYLAVYDSAEKQFPLFDTCGRVPPAPIRSTSFVLYVEFFNEGSRSSPAFQASWDIVDQPGPDMANQVCGGVSFPLIQTIRPLTGETSGILSQRGSTTDFKRGISCNWVIYAPTGQYVQITFLNFTSEAPSEAAGCESYLTAFDGENNTDPELMRFCGSTLPLSLTSSGNILHLQMVDFGPSPFLFEARWEYVNTSLGRPCDGTVQLSDSNGTVKSGARGYTTSTNCTFIIQAPAGQRIQLSPAYFALLSDASGNCSSTVLIVSGSDQLFKGCSKPTTLVSTTNSMQISFTSNVPTVPQADGFIFNYLFITPAAPTTVVPPSLPPSRTPSSPRPTAPTAVTITFSPTTGSPVSYINRTSPPVAAASSDKPDTIGIVIGVLLALLLVGVGGGIATHYYCKKKKAAKTMEGLDMREGAQDLDGKAAHTAPRKYGKTAKVQPVDDESETAGGNEITVL